jgi:hypothetical protein
MENNYLLYILSVQRKQTKNMECMGNPIFDIRKNKNPLYIWEKKKVRALYISSKNKDKKSKKWNILI